MNTRLIREHAEGGLCQLLDIISPVLTTESERREAFGLFAEALMLILQQYHISAERLIRRIHGPHKDI